MITNSKISTEAMEHEREREKITLAALLHDIGKFYQRAESNNKGRKEQSEYSKRLANDICDTDEESRFGYQHVVWTNEFLERFKGKLEATEGIKENIWDTEDEDNLANLACHHHTPRTALQAIVSMADWWSSGVERKRAYEREDGDERGDDISWGKESYKRIPLYSVFNSIEKGGVKGEAKMAFPMRPLRADNESCFPKRVDKAEDGTSQEEYKKIWEEFSEKFESLPTESYTAFAESLLTLLKKYTWCIPSNTTDMANVSLYDHLKTTAAFADALYVYYRENEGEFQWDAAKGSLSIKEGTRPVLLLGGDLSGIQNFIYNVTSKKAASSLKGRSFYLQLLTDATIQRILTHEDINCTQAQTVYSSGGKFYLILPNTEKTVKAIERVKKSIEDEIWDKHKGELSLNIDYVSFAYDSRDNKIVTESGNGKNIGDLWRELAEKLSANKNRKFHTVIRERYETMFIPQSVSGREVCAVTGIECKTESIGSGSEAIRVMPIVKKQIELGDVLKDADYIITSRRAEEDKYLKSKVKFDIEIAGIHTYLFNKKELTDTEAEFRRITSADVCRIKSINNTNFLDAQLKGQKVSYDFQFYGGNKQAENATGRNKTFEELSDDFLLGVVRMDVDGLGAIFINGLPQEAKSFSAYSTLSFLLDYFFSGYINSIRNKSEYKDNVNILYSGGDDVFAIGRWDKAMQFAAELREKFGKFTGREDISISGGMTIVRPKYPIAKAAEESGEAEDKAKSYKSIKYGEKNAFTMFGETFSWKEEYEYIKAMKEELAYLCSYENMPRSILHRIMTLNAERKREDYSYAWRGAYYLKRFSEKKSQKIISLCERLKDILLDRKFELSAIAARWAELELRLEEENKQ